MASLLDHFELKVAQRHLAVVKLLANWTECKYTVAVFLSGPNDLTQMFLDKDFEKKKKRTEECDVFSYSHVLLQVQAAYAPNWHLYSAYQLYEPCSTSAAQSMLYSGSA